jgi:hypothetical protein
LIEIRAEDLRFEQQLDHFITGRLGLPSLAEQWQQVRPVTLEEPKQGPMAVLRSNVMMACQFNESRPKRFTRLRAPAGTDQCLDDWECRHPGVDVVTKKGPQTDGLPLVEGGRLERPDNGVFRQSLYVAAAASSLADDLT